MHILRYASYITVAMMASTTAAVAGIPLGQTLSVTLGGVMPIAEGGLLGLAVAGVVGGVWLARRKHRPSSE